MNPPDIITRYLEASNRLDVAAAAACFCADAHVHDETDDHRGVEAVRSWIAETNAKYQARAEVRRAERRADRWLLTVHTSGSFPGSPVDLDYAIVLRDGKISSLHIS